MIHGETIETRRERRGLKYIVILILLTPFIIRFCTYMRAEGPVATPATHSRSFTPFLFLSFSLALSLSVSSSFLTLALRKDRSVESADLQLRLAGSRAHAIISPFASTYQRRIVLRITRRIEFLLPSPPSSLLPSELSRRSNLDRE